MNKILSQHAFELRNLQHLKEMKRMEDAGLFPKFTKTPKSVRNLIKPINELIMEFAKSGEKIDMTIMGISIKE